MDKKRPARASTLRAQANGANYSHQQMSDDDDDLDQVAANRAQQRASTRRIPKVDFHKLETSSLQKYKKLYKLNDVAGGSKDELIPSVTKHFATQVVDEEETLVVFAAVLRKQSVISKSNGIKKSQRAVQTKPKGR